MGNSLILASLLKIDDTRKGISEKTKYCFHTYGKYNKIIFSEKKSLKDLYLTNNHDFEGAQIKRVDHLCIGRIIAESSSCSEKELITPTKQFPYLLVTGIKISNIDKESYDSLAESCSKTVKSFGNSANTKIGLFEGLGFSDFLLIARSVKIEEAMKFLLKLRNNYESKKDSYAFDFSHSFIGSHPEVSINTTDALSIYDIFSLKPGVHQRILDTLNLLNNVDGVESSPLCLFGEHDFLINQSDYQVIQRSIEFFEDILEPVDQIIGLKVTDSIDQKSEVEKIIKKTEKILDKRCENNSELSEIFREVCKELKQLSNSDEGYKNQSVLSNLEVLISLIEEAQTSLIFDSYLLKELMSIVSSFFLLIKLSFIQVNSNFENKRTYYLAATESIKKGIQDLTKLIKYWSMGNKPTLSRPSTNIIPFSGSATKITYMYTIILNIFEELFEKHLSEKIVTFITIGYTEETRTNALFQFIQKEAQEEDLGRLLSIEISLEEFFEIRDGIMLLFHELGHALPLNRGERNRVLLKIFFEEILMRFFYVIFNPSDRLKLDYHKNEHLNESQIRDIVSKITRYFCLNTVKVVSNYIEKEHADIFKNVGDDELSIFAKEVENKYLFQDSNTENQFDYRGILTKCHSGIVGNSSESIADLKKIAGGQDSITPELIAGKFSIPLELISNINDINLFFNDLCILFSDQRYHSGISSKVKGQKEKFARSIDEIIKNFNQSESANEDQGACEKNINRVSFVNFMMGLFRSAQSLISEVKSDYIMVRLLNLSKDQYKILLRSHPDCRLSREDEERQDKDRLDILELIDAFDKNPKKKSKKNIQKLFGVLPNERISSYLNSCDSKLNPFMNNEIIMKCRDFCKTSHDIDVDIDFMNSIILAAGGNDD